MLLGFGVPWKIHPSLVGCCAKSQERMSTSASILYCMAASTRRRYLECPSCGHMLIPPIFGLS